MSDGNEYRRTMKRRLYDNGYDMPYQRKPPKLSAPPRNEIRAADPLEGHRCISAKGTVRPDCTGCMDALYQDTTGRAPVIHDRHDWWRDEYVFTGVPYALERMLSHVTRYTPDPVEERLKPPPVPVKTPVNRPLRAAAYIWTGSAIFNLIAGLVSHHPASFILAGVLLFLAFIAFMFRRTH